MNIEIHDDDINVKEIMRQIKENIAKRNIPNQSHLFQERLYESPKNVHLSELEEFQFVLNRIWRYSADAPITSHRSYGKLIIFAKKIIRKLLRWYINPVVEKQVEFNAHAVRALNSVTEQLKEFNEFKVLFSKEFERVKELEESVQTVEQGTVELKDQLENQITAIPDDKTQEIEMGKKKIKCISERLDELSAKLDAEIERQNKSRQDNADTRITTERVRRIERKLKNLSIDTSPEPILKEKQHEPDEELDFDYYLFEEYYRGPREEIKRRQSIYLPYFKDADHVLDLGCGRGEFTELMLENKIGVTSVDLHDDMVEYCKDRGFPIVQTDLLEFLKGQDDHSVGGIFLGQVIEHLSPKDLILLVQLSYKKLKPGGWFIAETPNPQCMSVFTQSFYMDITHTKPVHPYTAKFIAESAGFNQAEIHYISPNDEHLQLPKLEIEGASSDSLERFNQTIQHWNNTIFGYQDYFLAARK